DQQYSQNLKEYCSSVILVPLQPWKQKLKAGISMLVGEPWSLGYFSSAEMRKAVENELATHDFDLIFVYCSSMARYVEPVHGIPKILDFVDSDACKWSQYAEVKRALAKWLYRYEAQRLKDYEISLTNQFDGCVFVSPREAQHLPRNRRGALLFVPNGVDL